MTPFFVFLGAGLGGVARYGVGRLLATQSTTFPWNTLAINVTGSLLITAFATYVSGKGLSPQLGTFLTVGVCGGYTTFSAFSAETLNLAQGGQWGRAATYAAASVVLCVLASFAGLRLGSSLLGARA
ncbi:MAG TPA: CrcB family protein [Gemmatimonadaceae bacterium]